MARYLILDTSVRRSEKSFCPKTLVVVVAGVDNGASGTDVVVSGIDAPGLSFTAVVVGGVVPVVYGVHPCGGPVEDEVALNGVFVTAEAVGATGGVMPCVVEDGTL